MAAAGTSPALNLREKLAELAGLKQRVSPDLVRCDFTNLVTNGTFDTDTDWTKGTGWTIGSGVATHAGSAHYLDQTLGYTPAGRHFLLTATTTGVNTFAGATFALSNVTLTVGTNSYPFAGGPTSKIRFYSNASSTVDNVYLYEADPSDDAPWLRLPYGYKVGQRGMIVRDGVVLHPSDYTEITDSGQTWIKPIVAPGASTEFSIWAGA